LLAVPLQTSRDKVVGVLALINALNRTGEVIPFTGEDESALHHFAHHAAAAVERAQLTREIILRMIRLCEMRDPQETGAHANRVGAYAAEIYHQWALSQGIPAEEIKKTRDLIRIAAMLHDLGKIAVSDLILKKPGGLNRDEFTIMQYHPIYGARLLQNPKSDLDAMSGEIALTHHEKWDGSGYPGKIADPPGRTWRWGPGNGGGFPNRPHRGLADVYDALVSKRAYKDSFEAEALTSSGNSRASRSGGGGGFLEIYKSSAIKANTGKIRPLFLPGSP
jgi:HD-GYP domain-containing protein (c-di-GMP phosphodiesterase class II)